MNIVCRAALTLVVFLSAFSYAETLRIGTIEVANRGFYDENGKPGGSSFDIANRIVTEAGYEPSNVLMPYPRVLQYLESGEIDLAIVVANQSVRDIAYPMIHVQDVEFILVGRADEPINWQAEGGDKVVAHLRRSLNSLEMVEELGAMPLGVDQYSSMVQMLLHGRIDAVIGPRTNINWAMKEINQPLDKLGPPKTLHKLKLKLVFSKATVTHDTMNSLTETAKSLLSQQVIQGIIDSYE